MKTARVRTAAARLVVPLVLFSSAGLAAGQAASQALRPAAGFLAASESAPFLGAEAEVGAAVRAARSRFVFAPRGSRLLDQPGPVARPIASPPPTGTPWRVTNEPPAFGNGRLWLDNVFIGPVPNGVRSWPDRSPADYGAFGSGEGERALAVVGDVVVPISPWARFTTEGRVEFEEARAFYLRERGYTGGVRTFRNPVALRDEASGRPAAGGAPEPAGWFRAPPRAPRVQPVERALGPDAGGERVVFVRGRHGGGGTVIVHRGGGPVAGR